MVLHANGAVNIALIRPRLPR